MGRRGIVVAFHPSGLLFSHLLSNQKKMKEKEKQSHPKIIIVINTNIAKRWFKTDWMKINLGNTAYIAKDTVII